MWSPKGCRKLRKVVIDQNPYLNLEGVSKTAFSEVRRKPLKSVTFVISLKTVKKWLFLHFSVPREK